jgi:predicted hotdog family 3-hydroxylacyl-ACP dehydratase
MNDFAHLLPHRGSALMIERVVRWDAGEIVAATTLHRSPANPLRRDGRLAAVHLAEFAAQVMAIHGGLRNAAAGRDPQDALLVSVRDLELRRDFIDDLPGELEVAAQALLVNSESWQYAFTVRQAGTVIATGRAAAMAQSPAQAGGTAHRV